MRQSQCSHWEGELTRVHDGGSERREDAARPRCSQTGFSQQMRNGPRGFGIQSVCEPLHHIAGRPCIGFQHPATCPDVRCGPHPRAGVHPGTTGNELHGQSAPGHYPNHAGFRASHGQEGALGIGAGQDHGSPRCQTQLLGHARRQRPHHRTGPTHGRQQRRGHAQLPHDIIGPVTGGHVQQQGLGGQRCLGSRNTGQEVHEPFGQTQHVRRVKQGLSPIGAQPQEPRGHARRKRPMPGALVELPTVTLSQPARFRGRPPVTVGNGKQHFPLSAEQDGAESHAANTDSRNIARCHPRPGGCLSHRPDERTAEGGVVQIQREGPGRQVRMRTPHPLGGCPLRAILVHYQAPHPTTPGIDTHQTGSHSPSFRPFFTPPPAKHSSVGSAGHTVRPIRLGLALTYPQNQSQQNIACQNIEPTPSLSCKWFAGSLP